jgi:cell division septal protein FtsQ
MKDSMGGSLKFEADFFRKCNNLTVTREKKMRTIQVRTVHLLLLLCLTLLAALLVSRAANFLLSCAALQVRQFRLHGQPVYARERVAAILQRHAGNILAMDLKGLQAQLLQVPEVAAASIRRVLPDTVEVDFTLRRPFYQHVAAGGYRLLDEAGRELGRQKEAPAGLVPLRGDVQDLAAIAPFASELRPLRQEIEYVAWGGWRGIELKLLAAPEIFYPGESGFAGKIRQYFRVKGRLALKAPVRSVDLRIHGRIYFELDEEQRGNP